MVLPIKESYRDLTGRVRSRVMLNVGFIDEDHRPEDIRDIGKCLTYLYEHQGERDLFKDPFARYNDFVRRKSSEFWKAMVNGGSKDAVQKDIEASREKAGRLIDVDTVEHTDAREVGAEWICLQAHPHVPPDHPCGKRFPHPHARKNLAIPASPIGYY